MNTKTFSISPDRVRKIISLILTFLLSWMLFILFLSILGKSILSESYIHKVIKSSEYAKNLQAEILDKWESLGIPGGLPEHFFDNKLPTEDLENDLTNYIHAQYNGTSVDAPDIETKLYNAIISYAKTKMQITDDVDEQLKYLASLCADEYQTVVYHSGFRLLLPVAKASVTKLSLLFWISISITLFSAVFLFILHKSLKGLSIYIFYIFCTLGLLLLLFPLFCLIYGIPGQLGIADASLCGLVNRYIGNLNLYMSISAIIALGLSLGVFIGRLIFESPKTAQKI